MKKTLSEKIAEYQARPEVKAKRAEVRRARAAADREYRERSFASWLADPGVQKTLRDLFRATAEGVERAHGIR